MNAGTPHARLVLPRHRRRLTPTQIVRVATAAGVHEVTLRSFLDGAAIQPAAARRIVAAILELRPHP